MTAHNLAFLPDMSARMSRIVRNAKAENDAEERQASVERARRIIRKPNGYTDGQLRTACGFYMTHGDRGPDYLLADQHLFAINKRQQIARNRAKAAARVAAGAAAWAAARAAAGTAWAAADAGAATRAAQEKQLRIMLAE